MIWYVYKGPTTIKVNFLFRRYNCSDSNQTKFSCPSTHGTSSWFQLEIWAVRMSNRWLCKDCSSHAAFLKIHVKGTIYFWEFYKGELIFFNTECHYTQLNSEEFEQHLKKTLYIVLLLIWKRYNYTVTKMRISALGAERISPEQPPLIGLPIHISQHLIWQNPWIHQTCLMGQGGNPEVLIWNLSNIRNKEDDMNCYSSQLKSSLPLSSFCSEIHRLRSHLPG
jgi:hypothetical protein